MMLKPMLIELSAEFSRIISNFNQAINDLRELSNQANMILYGKTSGINLFEFDETKIAEKLKFIQLFISHIEDFRGIEELINRLNIELPKPPLTFNVEQNHSSIVRVRTLKDDDLQSVLDKTVNILCTDNVASVLKDASNDNETAALKVLQIFSKFYKFIALTDFFNKKIESYIKGINDPDLEDISFLYVMCMIFRVPEEEIASILYLKAKWEKANLNGKGSKDFALVSELRGLYSCYDNESRDVALNKIIDLLSQTTEEEQYYLDLFIRTLRLIESFDFGLRSKGLFFSTDIDYKRYHDEVANALLNKIEAEKGMKKQAINGDTLNVGEASKEQRLFSILKPKEIEIYNRANKLLNTLYGEDYMLLKEAIDEILAYAILCDGTDESLTSDYFEQLAQELSKLLSDINKLCDDLETKQDNQMSEEAAIKYAFDTMFKNELINSVFTPDDKKICGRATKLLITLSHNNSDYHTLKGCLATILSIVNSSTCSKIDEESLNQIKSLISNVESIVVSNKKNRCIFLTDANGNPDIFDDFDNLDADRSDKVKKVLLNIDECQLEKLSPVKVVNNLRIYEITDNDVTVLVASPVTNLDTYIIVGAYVGHVYSKKVYSRINRSKAFITKLLSSIANDTVRGNILKEHEPYYLMLTSPGNCGTLKKRKDSSKLDK